MQSKGWSGKTVTTVNLGIGLAREGKRVLLVDVDAQGSLTASLGYQQPDQIEVTLTTIMGGIISDNPLPPDMGIIHNAEGVDLLPANIELSGVEVTLVNTMSRETILRQYLQTVKKDYDVIILDCCPSLGMLTINALAAADQPRSFHRGDPDDNGGYAYQLHAGYYRTASLCLRWKATDI